MIIKNMLRILLPLDNTALKLRIANQAQQLNSLNRAIAKRNRRIAGLVAANKRLHQRLIDATYGAVTDAKDVVPPSLDGIGYARVFTGAPWPGCAARQGTEDAKNRVFTDAMNTVNEIMAQREEVLRAFVAKHGFQPDDAVQIQAPNGSWRIVPASQLAGAERYLESAMEVSEDSEG